MRQQQRQSDGEKVSFLTNDVETTRQPHEKKKSINTTSPFMNINSDWITNLNVKCKIIKLLEENVGENLGDLWYLDNFLDTAL